MAGFYLTFSSIRSNALNPYRSSFSNSRISFFLSRSVSPRSFTSKRSFSLHLSNGQLGSSLFSSQRFRIPSKSLHRSIIIRCRLCLNTFFLDHSNDLRREKHQETTTIERATNFKLYNHISCVVRIHN